MADSCRECLGTWCCKYPHIIISLVLLTLGLGLALCYIALVVSTKNFVPDIFSFMLTGLRRFIMVAAVVLIVAGGMGVSFARRQTGIPHIIGILLVMILSTLYLLDTEVLSRQLEQLGRLVTQKGVFDTGCEKPDTSPRIENPKVHPESGIYGLTRKSELWQILSDYYGHEGWRPDRDQRKRRELCQRELSKEWPETVCKGSALVKELTSWFQTKLGPDGKDGVGGEEETANKQGGEAGKAKATPEQDEHTWPCQECLRALLAKDAKPAEGKHDALSIPNKEAKDVDVRPVLYCRVFQPIHDAVEFWTAVIVACTALLAAVLFPLAIELFIRDGKSEDKSSKD